MKETKSNWACVTEELMQEVSDIHLGQDASYSFYKAPLQLLHLMSYYKFASKLIGKGKRVLDVGCNEGLGTFLVGKECGFAKGVDHNEEAIIVAKKNFKESFVEFAVGNFPESADANCWDAVINFNVIEHIPPESASSFIRGIANCLTSEGLAIIGTPSRISQEFASGGSKKGHINIYTHERLEKEMREHFDFVFMFAANDEVVHTGSLPLAQYFITVGCKKKR